jgi:radical SAM family uncharacterized protein/radical SAM-linked protein
VRRLIDPSRDFGTRLLEIEKPSRYLGGELGSIKKTGDGFLDIALCFPDLYEIGMSNNAIRILYSGLNSLPGVRCERVFAPAPDFEALLKTSGLPLYTLETGIPLHDADILGFSLGYELAATSILSILESGQIPIMASERGESDPIVIAGGPAASNPHPLSDFLDAAFIGEAEGAFFGMAVELAAMKSAGAGRAALLERLSREPAIWMPARGGRSGKRAVRAVFSDFSSTVQTTAFPVPIVKAVQEHGTVEIMRGCPNGCRFCHAGYFYRPQRVKPYSVIRAEVESLVRQGGYREITLSSLSSGDYPGVGELLSSLNSEWSAQRISFQLPSLKVNSFTLPLLKALAEVRKSGLTFAVETPIDAWQRCINKDVSYEKTIAILREAKAQGFRSAKFYFMIGLPVPGMGEGEADAIIEFFDRLHREMDIQVNVNIGTFVPKPHTPFQWGAQLNEELAMAAINKIRSGLRRYRNIKISYHSPFVSQLEGIISRGDERVGALLLEAYRRGARLDAWEERFDRELWRGVIESASWKVLDESCRQRDVAEALPWDDVSVRVSKASFARELARAQAGELTSGCSDDCDHLCGSCADEAGLVQNTAQPEVAAAPRPRENAPSTRLVFRFSKTGIARYYQHLSIVDALWRAFAIAEIPVSFSEGFNPMPRLETAQPLPLGLASLCEIGSVQLTEDLDTAAFIRAMNAHLPQGISIEEAVLFPIQIGMKQHSLGSLSWGSVFSISAHDGISGESTAVLADKLATRSLQHESLTAVGDGSIRLCLADPKSKDAGLLRVLESISGGKPPLSMFDITRLEYLASLGQDPVSFFEAFCTQASP